MDRAANDTIIDQLVASAAEKSTREVVEDAYAAGLLAGARAIANLLRRSEVLRG